MKAATVDVNLPDSSGFTPLMMALLPMRPGCTLERRLAVLRELSCKTQFDVNAPSCGFTATTWAAFDGRLELDVLKWLVEEARADVNRQDELGSFALHRAVESGLRRGSTEKISYLLACEKLDCWLRDRSGQLALDIALNLRGVVRDEVARTVVNALDSKVRTRALTSCDAPVSLCRAAVCLSFHHFLS